MTFPYQLIDLTHTLEPNIPTWEGGCGFSLSTDVDYHDCIDETQFRIMSIHMNAGAGTHMDAPNHCFPNGFSVNDFKLDHLCMPCVVIDVSEKVHEHYSVSEEDILFFEEKFGKIAKDTCVMIRTGWDKYWDTPEKYRNDHIFPTVSLPAAEILIKRGVIVLGIDTLSPDRPDHGFKVHQAFLGNNKILIENVTNLDKLPYVGSYIMLLPLKLKNATEAPVRLIALI